MTTSGHPDDRRSGAAWLFVLFASLYSLTCQGICTGDNLLHLEVVRTFVRTGSFSLPDPAYDPASTPFLRSFVARGTTGRLYLTLPPGLALASLPFGELGWQIERSLGPKGAGGDFDQAPVRKKLAHVRHLPFALITAMVNPVVSALLNACMFLFALDLGCSIRRAFCIATLLGVGTIVWPYATTYWTQPLVTGCLFGALWLLFRFARDRLSRHLLLAGALLGFATLTRYEVWVFVPWYLLYVVLVARREGGRPLAALAGVVTPLALFAALQLGWNLHRFGRPLYTGSLHQKTFGATFAADLLTTLPAHLLSPHRSIFMFSPPLILFLAAAVPFLRRRPGFALPLFGILATAILFYCRVTVWTTPASWGPRFLVLLTPFMLLPLADRPWTTPLRAGLAALLAVGLAIQLVAVLRPFEIGAITNYYGSDGLARSFTFRSEMIPQAQALVSQGPDLWWTRGTLSRLLGLTLLGSMALGGWRMGRVLSRTQTLQGPSSADATSTP